MTTQEFGSRVIQLLLEKSESEYVRVNDLCSSITEALSPKKISIEFPRALYLGSAMITVHSRDEEAQALAEGYSSTPPALFEAGYPQWWIENPVNPDGSRHADLRGVLLRTSAEYRQFANVVEIEGWCQDPARMYGARAIGLDELVAQRRAALSALIAAENFDAVAIEVEAEAEAEDSAPAEEEVR
jgi:hypothetical protein